MIRKISKVFLVIWTEKMVRKILSRVSVATNLTDFNYGMDEKRIIPEMVNKVTH